MLLSAFAIFFWSVSVKPQMVMLPEGINDGMFLVDSQKSAMDRNSSVLKYLDCLLRELLAMVVQNLSLTNLAQL
jgi:hypothetical protein